MTFEPEKVNKYSVLGKGAKLIIGPPELKVERGDIFTCVHSHHYEVLLGEYRKMEAALDAALESILQCEKTKDHFRDSTP